MDTICVSQVCFDYDGQPVLTGISLDIRAGERIAVLGPNGVGKTTLLKLLSGARSPSRGSILLDGRRLHTVPRPELARKIAVVPQDLTVTFAFTAREIVELGRTPHLGLLRGFRSHDRFAVDQAMQLTDTIDLGERTINELSGGERQRVIIAMALAQEPEILLLDEPTHLLDITRQAEILDLVAELNRHRGLTAVATMHDLNLAGRYFNRLMILHRGTVLAEGAPEAVLRADIVEEAYGGPVEIVQSGNGRPPIVLPASRFHDGVNGQ
ncbi:MAG: heme ABC transporter ATP-binding protein [Acidobacteria bacterium]|nr:MAG: heme ABC transporter ATP-binding protein [Acidobacteriota bacterium]